MSRSCENRLLPRVCLAGRLASLWLVGGCLAIFPLTHARCDDAPPPKVEEGKKPSEAELKIAQWIRDLQSDEYVTRRKAFLELWSQGQAALPQIHSALSVKDPQTATAAKMLELLLRLEITPQDNDELAELANLSRGSVMGTLKSLAQKGHWRLSRELLKTNRTLWSDKLDELRFDDLSEVVQAAFDQGDATEAWPAVSTLLVPHQRHYLGARARQQLARLASENGADPDRTKSELERLSITGADFQALPVDEQALYLLYDGKVDEAWALEASSSTRLRMATHAGRWPWLKDERVKPLVLGATNDSLTSLAQQAAFAYLADDIEESDRLLKATRAQIDQSIAAFGLQATPELLDALMICGDGETLSKLVTNSREYMTHFQNTLEYDRALEAFQLSADMDQEQFESWAKRVASRPARGQARDPQNLRTYTEVAQLLVSIGQVEKGRLLFRKLFEAILNQGGQERHESFDTLLSAARRSQLRKTAIELLDKNDGKINPETRQSILMKLYSEWRQSEWQYSADRLFSTMPEEIGTTDQGLQRWQAMERLWRADPTLVSDPQSARLVEQWLEATMQDSLKMGNAADRICPELARIAMRLGLRRLTQTLIKATPRIALNDTADILQLSGNYENAATFWDAAIARRPSQHEWIHHQITTLQMLGDRERAAHYETSLWLRPLSPVVGQQSETTHFFLAMELYRQGAFELARDHAQAASALCETNDQFIIFAGEWLGRACLELEEFSLGAHGWRQAALNMFMARTTLPIARDTDFEEREAIAAFFILMQAAADLEAGKVEVALDRIGRYETLRPGGIEICEHCYPRLIKAGKQAEAEQLLQRCADRMLQHLKKWPSDAGNHNNYAWMLARCNVRLEEALQHAQLAVQLSEREPTYLDTLAEAEFRLGHYDNAIALAKECLALDPRHAHYRTQLERFRSQRKD